MRLVRLWEFRLPPTESVRRRSITRPTRSSSVVAGLCRIAIAALLSNTFDVPTSITNYDLAGNRLWNRVTQKDHDNDRSWKYGYDPLHRLISAGMGRLDFIGQGAGMPVIVPGPNALPVPRVSEWNLDNLGNWTGNPEDAAPIGLHQTGDFNGNGLADDGPRDLAHVTNAANEIRQHIRYDEMTYAPTVTTFIHDPAGNLAFDGQYVYQYDGWNRLIQVNVVGELPPNWNGRVLGATEIGALVCRYTYDGLGRLIFKETPVVEGANTYVQRKDFYYDGVRRIQEWIRRGDLGSITGEGGNDEGALDPNDPENPNAAPPPTQYLWTDRAWY
jgi:YD repeat-containing protein